MIASIELNDTPGIYAEFLNTETCVSGSLFDMEDEHLADYLVYCIAMGDNAANIALQFDFIFKEWNEDSETEEGALVSLIFSKNEGGFGFSADRWKSGAAASRRCREGLQC